MRGLGKMLSAGARASSAFAGGGEFLEATNRAGPLAVAVRAGTLSVTTGGEAFFLAVDDEALAVPVRTGKSSVVTGGEMCSVAVGREPLAVAVRAGTSSVVTRGETCLVAGDGEPFAVSDGRGARMTGGGSIGTSGGGPRHHQLRPLQRQSVAGGGDGATGL
jgi:hypothetical protein